MSPRDLSAGPSVRTTCPYCGTGCGVLVTPDGQGGATVQGDPDHPANFGRLCSKGSALGETLSPEGRLLHPMINGRRAGWDEATALVARKFRAAIHEYGPESVAIYGSGQLLTEDYYVANKLMKGFIGAANIDTNSRLCMASTVAGHKRAFGTDTVPGTYEDLEVADLVVLVGSNLAWCHPVLYQRLAAAKEARPQMRVINIDPRRTATSALADMHLAIRPDGDAALFNDLLAEIGARRATDADFLSRHVSGFAQTMAAASLSRRSAIAATGLTRAQLNAFHDMWIGAEKVVTVFSQGVNQSAGGTDKVNAIINCHLATGRIGRPGMGPFSVTGQPNAMGGREVGGLSNMLAAHLDIENPAHRMAVREFWGAPRIADRPGLKAVDLFRACAESKIKALWIMSTNPAVSMPDADAVAAAIRATPFVAVSDMMADTDTTRLADVLLPAAGWGEKSGTVTNSDRTISRQRAFLTPPGEARPDWRIICDVAAGMGWGTAFDYAGPADIFREHAALSGVAGRFGLDFDISALSKASRDAYETLPPQRWPVSANRQGGRFFADGRFFTPDQRARMIPLAPPSVAPLAAPTAFRLNTGRVRDQWHTMTRTAKADRLNEHYAEPFVEIHPEDAAALGIRPADIAQVDGPGGTALLRALVTDRVRRGELFAPMHWSAANTAAGRIGPLAPAQVDPVSGQPALKAGEVELARFNARWFAFACSLEVPSAPVAEYWALARRGGAWAMEIAGDAPQGWRALAGRLFPGARPAASLRDDAGGRLRVALERGGRLVGAIHAAPSPVAVDRGHALARLLAGDAAGAIRPGVDGRAAPTGPVICACNNVRLSTIRDAMEAGAHGLSAVAAKTGAGGNCGSCRSEIQTLLSNMARRDEPLGVAG